MNENEKIKNAVGEMPPAEEAAPAEIPGEQMSVETLKKIIRQLIIEVIEEKQSDAEEETPDEEDAENAAEILKEERKRVCNLLSFENCVDKKIIMETIQGGGDEKDLGLAVLNMRKIEMQNKKEALKIKNKDEEKALGNLRGASNTDELNKILKDLNLK